MGGILQAAIAVSFAVVGPLYAAFNLAIFVPFSNAKVRLPREQKTFPLANPHSILLHLRTKLLLTQILDFELSVSTGIVCLNDSGNTPGTGFIFWCHRSGSHATAPAHLH